MCDECMSGDPSDCFGHNAVVVPLREEAKRLDKSRRCGLALEGIETTCTGGETGENTLVATETHVNQFESFDVTG